jgi:hypothetical protein
MVSTNRSITRFAACHGACFGLVLLALASAGSAGCAAPPAPVARTAAVEKPPPAPPPSPEPAAAPDQPPPAVAPPQDKPRTVDVVEPGGEPGTVSLVQAAKAERERRAHAGEPVAVITDKTLPHLPKGKLTFADPVKQQPGPAQAAPGDVRDEQYWRSRALEIRTRWKEAADAVKDLETSAAGWRRRFYAEDDPYIRDAQIKPEWDRVLDRLAQARKDVEAAKQELTVFLDEGRRAGALPGWLREGAELEPVEKPKSKEPGSVEPEEPPIYHQNEPPNPRSDHGA